MRRFAVLLLAASAWSCSKDSPTERGPLIVTIAPANPRVQSGTEVQLTAEVTGAPGLNQLFDWSSSQPTVATVSLTGFVTALREGSAVITATWNGDSTVTGTTRVDVFTDITPAGQPASPLRSSARQ